MRTTFDQLLRDHELRHLAVERRRDSALAAVKLIADTAQREGRATLTPEESDRVEQSFAARDRAKVEMRELDEQLAQLRAQIADERQMTSRQAESHPTGVRMPAYDHAARIGREARTYHPGRDREAGGTPGTAFLLDVGRGFLGDPLAQDRLVRHQREELAERSPGALVRATSSNFAGFVVPQYLVDLYAPAVAAMRPFADICTHHDLPPQGMTVNVGRITTPTSVALQSSENTTVSNQDIDDTLLTENVQTAAGYVTVSRQAIERGQLTEGVTTDDLFKRYATTLDSTLINQAATGLAATSTGQTYTNATVDTTAVPTFWKQLVQAQNSVETALLAQAPPSHFVMSPRRFNWASAAVSSSWPVIAGTNVPPQSWALQLTKEYGPSVVAELANGMRITKDANVSTACSGTALTGGTQDQVYVVAADECHLWESPDAPILIRAEQVASASLGIQFVAYGYFAYTMRRYPGAFVVVNGSGLATPSFA